MQEPGTDADARQKPPSIAEVSAFLARLHGSEVAGIEPLPSGYWSAAYGYRVDGRELVLRLGSVPEGFAMDRAAMAFARPGLPVPEVLDVGSALGGAYAISVRQMGRFLESISPSEAERAAPAVDRMLAALRAAPAPVGASASWFPDAGADSWRGWLCEGLVDDPARRVSGWRRTLAADAGLDRLFRAAEQRIESLLDACPERRDLVHGDLLNRNVLIADDLTEITAVFSWKCSARGDFLFDVAWCTFWGPWHPGIAALDLFARTTAAVGLPRGALVDAALRHHCYELQIGARHLGWNAWTGDDDSLRGVAARLAEVLERGPLPAP
jgi:aminoglycoside phosphotransferase (APT) family kinase protein